MSSADPMAMVELLRTAGRSPALVWRCAKGCMLLEVWFAGELGNLVRTPGGRQTTFAGRKVGSSGQPVPKNMVARWAAHVEPLDRFNQRSPVLFCKHHEVVLPRREWLQQDLEGGVATRSIWPDGDVVIATEGLRTDGNIGEARWTGNEM